MRLLAIGAHPDDIEFGCGGTIIKYAREGHEPFMLVMTMGEEGHLGGDPRGGEQVRAAELMGVKEVFWGGFEDTRIPTSKEPIDKVEEVIKKVKPSLIFTHWPEDTHQDHRHIAEATSAATRYIKNVLYFEGPTTLNFSPSVFVDISATIEEKINALRAHSSQVMRTMVEDMSIVDLARSAATFRGIQGRVKLAEGFVPSRLFLDV